MVAIHVGQGRGMIQVLRAVLIKGMIMPYVKRHKTAGDSNTMYQS